MSGALVWVLFVWLPVGPWGTPYADVYQSRKACVAAAEKEVKHWSEVTNAHAWCRPRVIQ